MTAGEQTVCVFVSPPDLAGTAMERSKLYGLLATIFRREPTPDLLERLRTPAMRAVLDAAGVELGESFFHQSLAQLAERSAVEYTYLLLGPGKHISPHESVQLKRGSGILWGEETGIVKRFMQAAGFELDADFAGIPDHLAVELEFLSHLTAREAEAWQAGDKEAARAALGWQRRFLTDHLGKWAARLCRKVEAAAETPLYGQFAKLLRRFLAGEKAEVMSRLKAAKAGDNPTTGWLDSTEVGAQSSSEANSPCQT